MTRLQGSPVGVDLFVVVSGLPGSGKTTLARRLAPFLSLSVIDKDDILEELFQLRGVGDDAWRGALSREADALLQQRALAARRAILVSFWHQAGMAPHSGTEPEWLGHLPGTLVHLSCVCTPTLAADRFLNRDRHPGHLDAARSREQLVGQFEALSTFPQINAGPVVRVDTSQEPDAERIAERIRAVAGIAS